MKKDKMRLKSLLLLLAAYSTLGASTCGPQMRVYVSNPADKGMDYSDPKGQSGFVPYTDTDKFICLEPHDAETLLNYCRVSQK